MAVSVGAGERQSHEKNWVGKKEKLKRSMIASNNNPIYTR